MITIDLLGVGVSWAARQWLHDVVGQENWNWDDSIGLYYERIVFKYEEDAIIFKLRFLEK